MDYPVAARAIWFLPSRFSRHVRSSKIVQKQCGGPCVVRGAQGSVTGADSDLAPRHVFMLVLVVINIRNNTW